MEAFSFDIKGRFAFFKKNDANDVVLTSYNFIHKPAVLGILGAILGLKGYSNSGNGKLPEYFKKLRNLKIAVTPHYKYPLRKGIVYFNNATGFASSEKGGVWQVKEQILIGEPYVGYTIFVFIEDYNENKELKSLFSNLKKRIKNKESYYLPYFGKNEFFAYFDRFNDEYNLKPIENLDKYYVFHSLVKKEDVEKKEINFENFDPFELSYSESLTIYENLPIDLDENGFYIKKIMQWSDKKFKIRKNNNFYTLNYNGEEINVQFL